MQLADLAPARLRRSSLRLQPDQLALQQLDPRGAGAERVLKLVDALLELLHGRLGGSPGSLAALLLFLDGEQALPQAVAVVLDGGQPIPQSLSLPTSLRRGSPRLLELGKQVGSPALCRLEAGLRLELLNLEALVLGGQLTMTLK